MYCRWKEILGQQCPRAGRATKTKILIASRNYFCSACIVIYRVLEGSISTLLGVFNDLLGRPSKGNGSARGSRN